MSVLVSRSFTSMIERIMGQPEVVRTIDITPYLRSIETLGKIARFVKSNPYASEDAKMMAYIICEMDAHIGEDTWRQFVKYD